MRYRKKPVEIEAMVFDGTFKSADRILVWSKSPDLMIRRVNNEEKFEIVTLEGVMSVSPGDYVIKGVNGEFYPCKPDIFKKTYDRVEE